MKSRFVVMFGIGMLLVMGLLYMTTASVFAKEDDEKTITSSVKIPSKGAQISELAKLNLVEAINIALKSVEGKAIKARLEDENGYLMFSVEVLTADKSITDVKIDPSTGQVLKKEIEKENDDNDDKENEEKNE